MVLSGYKVFERLGHSRMLYTKQKAGDYKKRLEEKFIHDYPFAANYEKLGQ